MVLTRAFRQTVAERVQRDPEFARALLDEAATLFLDGEPHTSRLLLRDLEGDRQLRGARRGPPDAQRASGLTGRLR